MNRITFTQRKYSLMEEKGESKIKMNTAPILKSGIAYM